MFGNCEELSHFIDVYTSSANTVNVKEIDFGKIFTKPNVVFKSYKIKLWITKSQYFMFSVIVSRNVFLSFRADK